MALDLGGTLGGVTKTVGGAAGGGIPAVPAGVPAVPGGPAQGGQEPDPNVPSTGLNVGNLVGLGSNEKAAIDLLPPEKREAEIQRLENEKEEQRKRDAAQQGGQQQGGEGGPGQQQGANQQHGYNQQQGQGGQAAYRPTQSGGGGNPASHQCGCNHSFYPVCPHNQGYSVPVTFYFSHMHCSTCQPTHPAPGGYGGSVDGGGNSGYTNSNPPAPNCVAVPPRRAQITKDDTAQAYAVARKQQGDPRDVETIKREALSDMDGHTTDYTDRSGVCSQCGKPWSNHPAH